MDNSALKERLARHMMRGARCTADSAASLLGVSQFAASWALDQLRVERKVRTSHKRPGGIVVYAWAG